MSFVRCESQLFHFVSAQQDISYGPNRAWLGGEGNYGLSAGTRYGPRLGGLEYLIGLSIRCQRKWSATILIYDESDV